MIILNMLAYADVRYRAKIYINNVINWDNVGMAKSVE
jgi:hypothetical protein